MYSTPGSAIHGSSPLTRGKPQLLSHAVRRLRLIPAHAGKTSRRRCRRWRAGAHPRSRGENAVTFSDAREVAGSSPLTRGKQYRRVFRGNVPGLIPAHAGKTLRRMRGARSASAHPRSRGENPGQMGTGIVGAGSSPLTRGKPPVPSDVRDRAGLIPAHAGKTPFVVTPRVTVRAHPRSRGENIRPESSSTPKKGSSPLTRGKLDRGPDVRHAVRLIPAHAGKTLRVRPIDPRVPAHPRSRGENAFVVGATVTVRGSSPLTRGKPSRRSRWPARWRLIPAHAGKTRRRGRPSH